MKSACFTGHRRITGNIELLYADMYNKLERAIKNGGIVHYFAGGAWGFDTVAAETVLKLRETFPQITLGLVLPCRREDQTLKWDQEQRDTYDRILSDADSVEYTADRYYKGCMQERNARLVELAEFCFCYWDGKKFGGTYQTINCAKLKRIDIWNFLNSRLIHP